MCAFTHITINRNDGASWFEKLVYVSVCHYCKTHDDLIVIQVDDQRDYYAVKCGKCGMSGPWGCSEEEAVDRWNEMTNIKKEYLDDLSDWRKTGTVGKGLAGKDIPF